MFLEHVGEQAIGRPYLRRRKADPNSPALFSDFETPAALEPHSEPQARGFFNAQRTASAVKSKIVVDYFTAWARVMKTKTRSGKIGYFDFFAGPGIYADGTESTPLQIARTVLADEQLRKITLMLFEDKDPDAAQSLSKALAGLDGVDSLAYAPKISHGESARKQIEDLFKTRSLIPTFMFLDPFGYAGLTRDLMQAILKDWGCEIAFYFNFNRINAAVRNSKVRSHMNALFGAERVEAARTELTRSADEEARERILLGGMRDALYDIGAKHVLQYRFRKPTGAVDHHIMFATKNLDPAQKIMKGIMARASSDVDQDGVASFEFNPGEGGLKLPLSGETPMQRLTKELPSAFRGQRLTVASIYAAHNESTPFTIKNYQDALRILAYDMRVVSVERGEFMPLADNNISRRHMSESYVITFADEDLGS